MPALPGFFGKIPARGDFVAVGLPADVTSSWDQFISCVFTAARTTFANTWPDVWLQAPVWRYALAASMCGRAPLLGMWMPSIDKVGRHFPLMIATTCPSATPEQMGRHGTAWLDLAEGAGRAAIAADLTPGQLTTLVPPSPDLSAEPDTGLPYNLQPHPGSGLWWTQGSPLVQPHGLVLDRLPDQGIFVTMLDSTQTAP